MKDEKYGLAGSELKFDGPSESEIVPEFLNECRIGDSYYALPFMRSTEACYINKTYVEAMGYEIPDILTWDYIWEVSEAATKKDADGNFLVNGQKTMIPFIYKSTDNMMISMLKQKDAGYSDENGNILIFNDTTREILRTVAEHAGSYAFSTFKISRVYDDPANLFVAKFLGTPPINVFKGRVKKHMIYIGDNAILKAEKAEDGDVYVGIRPEGFIPDEKGELEVSLKGLEVMGRDTTIVSDHKDCENVEIRSIVSAETRIDTAAGSIRFKVKPAKTHIFDAESGERIYY